MILTAHSGHVSSGVEGEGPQAVNPDNAIGSEVMGAQRLGDSIRALPSGISCNSFGELNDVTFEGDQCFLCNDSRAGGRTRELVKSRRLGDEHRHADSGFVDLRVPTHSS